MMCQAKLFVGMMSLFALFVFFAVNYTVPTFVIFVVSFIVWFFWRLAGLVCEVRRREGR